MEKFLVDFGLEVAQRNCNSLYAKALNGAPYCHVTTLGDPAFQGIGFELESRADVEEIARKANVDVEACDGPASGVMATLFDPDGFRVDAVSRSFSEARLPPERPSVNSGRTKPRQNSTSRIQPEPACVLRFGHCMLQVSNFRESQEWYHEHFGLIISDEVRPPGEAAIGAFMRCDRGNTPVDHHTVFLLSSDIAKFNHAAFEVDDFNVLMAGHDHLRMNKYKSEWGVGRHILGSQIFDYWRDPWGHTLEHFTDGDLFDASDESRIADLGDLLGTQWGSAAPPTMVE